MGNIDIPLPPKLDTKEFKIKKNVIKEGLDDFDKQWLSDRKKELTRLKIKNKHKELLHKIFPFFNKGTKFSINEKPSSVDSSINKQYAEEVNGLLQKRKEKIKLLKSELSKWKKKKNLTDEEKGQIRVNEAKIKEMENDHLPYKKFLEKRDNDIRNERGLHEDEIEKQRKHEYHHLRKRDIEKHNRINELKNTLEQHKLDKLRKSDISSNISKIKLWMKDLQNMMGYLNVKRMPQQKIEIFKGKIKDEQEFKKDLLDTKAKVDEYKRLVNKNKTFLIRDISELIDYFDSYKRMAVTIRNQLNDRLNQLEQINIDEENERKSLAKKSFHEDLIDERKKELEELKLKKERTLKKELKREILKRKIGIKPKKFHHHFEIQDAIGNIKRSHNKEISDLKPELEIKDSNPIYPNPITPTSEVKNIAKNGEKEATFPSISFETNDKDWLEEFTKKGYIKEAQFFRQPENDKKRNKIKKINFEFDIKGDWLKEFFRRKNLPFDKIGKQTKPALQSENIEKIITPKFEFDIGQDWLSEFLSNKINLGKVIIKKNSDISKPPMPPYKMTGTKNDNIIEPNASISKNSDILNDEHDIEDKNKLHNIFNKPLDEVASNISDDMPVNNNLIEPNNKPEIMEKLTNVPYIKGQKNQNQTQKIKKIIEKAKKIDWELDLDHQDWMKDFLKKKLSEKQPQPEIKPINNNKSTEQFTPEKDVSKGNFDVDKEKSFDHDMVKTSRKIKKHVFEDIPHYSKYGDGINYIEQMIFLARTSLIAFDLRKAKDHYIDIINVYNRLDELDKLKVYSKIKDLYDERKSAERLFDS